MKHLKSLVSAIVKAEQLAPQRPDLQDLLTTLAFQEETLAREIMVYLQLADFDLDSDHTRECQRVMTEFCSGSSSTKDILESTFAHLAYVAGASNKNKRVSNFAAWFYAAASPYVQASGMPQSLPIDRDWISACAQYGISKENMMGIFWKAFRSDATSLPSASDVKIPMTAAGIQKTTWRLAGPASHYNSSAAAAYLLFDSRTSFANCTFTWAGFMGLTLFNYPDCHLSVRSASAALTDNTLFIL